MGRQRRVLAELPGELQLQVPVDHQGRRQPALQHARGHDGEGLAQAGVVGAQHPAHAAQHLRRRPLVRLRPLALDEAGIGGRLIVRLGDPLGLLLHPLPLLDLPPQRPQRLALAGQRIAAAEPLQVVGHIGRGGQQERRPSALGDAGEQLLQPDRRVRLQRPDHPFVGGGAEGEGAVGPHGRGQRFERSRPSSIARYRPPARSIMAFRPNRATPSSWQAMTARSVAARSAP
jgi:hypothetical protein